MGDKEESNLKGGHPPAVKAGGMRITQHKTHHDKPSIAEDVTGLTMSGSPPKAVNVAGVIAKGNADFPTEAVQAVHKEKPPAPVCIKPQVNIQQPRK